MILSPLAPDFTPNNVHFAIYNNGVPSMISASKRGESEIIAGLSDEVLDMIFPLTAEDVAEMEECDAFVEVLATLSLLEDQEFTYRERFGSFHTKRWEARREDGLLGRPRAARNTIEPKIHRGLGQIREDHPLVRFNPNKKHIEIVRKKNFHGIESKALKASRKFKNFGYSGRPILQPRKQN